MPPTDLPQISLLYPADSQSSPTRHGAPNDADLGLAPIIAALDLDRQHSRFIRNVLAALETNPAIISYRQNILDDLLRLPGLAEQLEQVLPSLRALAEAGPAQRWHENTSLLLVAARLADLSNYVNCVEGLATALDHGGLQAAGLLALQALVGSTRASADYQRLVDELPRLRAQLDHAGSVTIGVNLDAQLQPESATIVSVNHGRFSSKSNLLDRLIGERNAGEVVRGITALYKASENATRTPEHEFFRDMNRLLERVAAPVAGAIERYARLSSGPLKALEPELVFYLGAARLTTAIRSSGLSMSRPQIAMFEDRACDIQNNYSLDLALRQAATSAPRLVTNDVPFTGHTTVVVLTGPNSGGKTTYTRAIGQAQVLFQAGLFVPATTARISPVDGIYTHFATAERLDMDGGRLAEELERLAHMFGVASSNSLVLLNEPFSSTDHRSARALARDVLAGLRLLGARTLYVTHLHEIIDDLLPDSEGLSADGVLSLTAGTELDERQTAETPTYKIAPGRPRASAYAAELARRYGLSFEQIEKLLEHRDRFPQA